MWQNVSFSVMIKDNGQDWLVEGDATVTLGAPETGRFGGIDDAQPADPDECEIDWGEVTAVGDDGADPPMGWLDRKDVQDRVITAVLGRGGNGRIFRSETMPGNTVKINDGWQEWYVGDSKMEELLKWLEANGSLIGGTSVPEPETGSWLKPEEG